MNMATKRSQSELIDIQRQRRDEAACYELNVINWPIRRNRRRLFR